MSRETILDNEFGKLEVEYYLGVPYIHLNLYQWSPKLYKAYKKVWGMFLHQMSLSGHPCVFCAIPEGDDKLLKFEKMFGFKEVTRDGGVILLIKDTE